MKTNIVLLLVAICIVNAQLVPDFAPLSYTGNYFIQGTTYSRVSLNPGFISTNQTTLVVNSNKQRILWKGDSGSTMFITFNNGSYFYGTSFGPGCAFRPDYNYSRYLAEFAQSFRSESINIPFFSTSKFFGSVYNSGSCGAKLQHTTDTLNGAIVHQTVEQVFYQPLLGVCFRYQADIQLNPLTVRTSSAYVDNNPDFTLPAMCYNPVDYCSTAYPGNACAVPVVV